ncbi:hypothetical protein [Lactobacillus mulieris]|uniref:hypothetical protein n=1 Tax=Lactobacillus mulieris TaxID=2508708 RepID=UPI0022AC1A1C|nr:hypothetical protein [Lactobacillus mulieris]MCZ3742193.1 hypothetical protein [Lactobacillus mulieris]MCZ3749031.1 hypothetical protein [Lactobacillus mulieris]MCZ3750660.1 hypothetical protein [Lactobacillus mulieris]MDT9629389.1 hypothetical protein [Lactobacillus mulieris]
MLVTRIKYSYSNGKEEIVPTLIDLTAQLSELELKVYSCIPKGKANAISQKELAIKVGINPRSVGSIIQKLRTKYFLAIGSSRDYPRSGYFRISSLEEFNQVKNMLINSRDELDRTISCLDKTEFGFS